jgi:hypothetical protein
MNKLVVTLVNWNGRDMLEECLESVQRQSFQNFSMIIVDNGSDDGSVEFLRKNYADIELIEFDHNTGFAYPHTVAIKKALQDPQVEYILTLNNDTALDPDFFAEMVAAAQRHPEAGSIQGKVVNFYDESLIDCTGILVHWDMSAVNRGQGKKDTGQYAKEEEIFGPSASAALYRREALEKTQLPNGDIFDSSYFAYYEDVDLAWRLRLAGYSSWYTPKAIIKHIHSATGVSHSPFKAFHIHRNHYFNMIKNLPFWFLVRALLFMPFRYVLLLSSLVLKKGAAAELNKKTHGSQDHMVLLVLRSWWHVLKNLIPLIRKRQYIQGDLTIVSTHDVRTWFFQHSTNIRHIIYGSIDNPR